MRRAGADAERIRQENAAARGEAFQPSHGPSNPAGRELPIGPHGGPSVQTAYNPAFGSQLTQRVKSGVASPQQAMQTSKERETFEKAYGKNWRFKVFGGTSHMGEMHGMGMMAKLRRQLKRNPNSPQLRAYYETLMRRRAEMLKHAEAKLAGAGDGGTTAPS